MPKCRKCKKSKVCVELDDRICCMCVTEMSQYTVKQQQTEIPMIHPKRQHTVTRVAADKHKFLHKHTVCCQKFCCPGSCRQSTCQDKENLSHEPSEKFLEVFSGRHVKLPTSIYDFHPCRWMYLLSQWTNWKLNLSCKFLCITFS